MVIQAEAGVEEDLQLAALEMESSKPQEILEWGIGRYHPDITLACSFGGITGMALLDMAVRIEPNVNVFYLDTGFLFPETYSLLDQVKQRYEIEPVAYRSRWSPLDQAHEFGDELWKHNPDLCCEIRKVEPNLRALDGNRAWIAGLRRDQSSTRRMLRVVEWDDRFGLVKLNPLAAWSEAQVMEYIKANDVPYNPLYDKGYLSIGCMQCTRAVKPGEDPRAGRWADSSKIECGLHLPIKEIS